MERQTTAPPIAEFANFRFAATRSQINLGKRRHARSVDDRTLRRSLFQIASRNPEGRNPSKMDPRLEEFGE